MALWLLDEGLLHNVSREVGLAASEGGQTRARLQRKATELCTATHVLSLIPSPQLSPQCTWLSDVMSLLPQPLLPRSSPHCPAPLYLPMHSEPSPSVYLTIGHNSRSKGWLAHGRHWAVPGQCESSTLHAAGLEGGEEEARRPLRCHCTCACTGMRQGTK